MVPPWPGPLAQGSEDGAPLPLAVRGSRVAYSLVGSSFSL